MKIGTQHIKTNFPKSGSLFFKYFFYNFILFGFARLLFLHVNRAGLNESNSKFLWKSLYLGFKFDLRLTALLCLPLLIFLIVPMVDLIKNGITRKLLFLIQQLLYIFVLLAYFTDFGFYTYLDARLSSAVLKFLENPLISAQMVWQTYPVIWGALLFFILLSLHVFIYQLLIGNYLRTYQIVSFKSRFGTMLLAFVCFVGSAYGKFAYYPLRWSEAYFSSDPFISNYTINPVLNFFDTLKYRGKNFDKAATKKYYSLVSEYLGCQKPDAESLNFVRSFDGKETLLKGMNVVVIMLESLAYNKTSLSDNPLDPTPFLKQIAPDSLFFSNHFTPTEATARGVFASITSNPDLTVGRGSSSRNPFIVNQNSVINYFKGYKKFYFLGGSASWGNIRGIFTNNLKDAEVFEEGSYSSPRIDVWGISDLDLFKEANQVLVKQEKPFFAFIQTSGFHRPYTIPENNYGYEVKKHPQEKVDRYAFFNNDEYNSIRLQDHALKKFFEWAKKEEYFNNTLFVIYGDHGLPSIHSDNVPLGMIKHHIINHHVPLLFYAPGKLEPKEDKKIASQVDIMPTIASLLGVPYKIQTLGRDLTDKQYDDKRKAFLYTWHAKPEKFSLLDEDFIYIRQGEREGLYQYKSDDPLKDFSSEMPEVFSSMKELAHGLLESGKYLMFHNKKLD